MSSSWIRVDSKSNGKSPYKGQKGEDTQRHRREGHVKIPMKTETEVGVMCPQGEEYQRWLAPNLASVARRKGWNGTSLSVFRRIQPCGTPISDFWSLELRENNLCCFKPPNLLSLAALENEYNQTV